MPPVVSLIGKPDCGKTTLLEKLLPELANRGLRVGTIKHHVHGFEMDTPAKDSWRHKQAGAHTVALSSPTGLGIIRDTAGDTAVEELVDRYFQDLDLVITEGYKKSTLPKIEVFRSTAHNSPLGNRDTTLIATVSDIQLYDGLPRFQPDDISGLADFLIDRLVKPDARSGHQTFSVRLAVDGTPIELTPFVKTFLARAVHGMVSTLNGCRHPQNIQLTLIDPVDASSTDRDG